MQTDAFVTRGLLHSLMFARAIFYLRVDVKNTRKTAAVTAHSLLDLGALPGGNNDPRVHFASYIICGRTKGTEARDNICEMHHKPKSV